MANKFWVGGTGTWDGGTLDSGFWKTATGGSTTTTAPTSADVAIFDSLSGGGTVTVVGDMTVSGMTCSSHTGTLDFASSNITFNGTTSVTGAGVHTVKWGSGTHTFKGNFSYSQSGTNLTLDVGTGTFVYWPTGQGGGTMMPGLCANRIRLKMTTGTLIQWNEVGGSTWSCNYLELDPAGTGHLGLTGCTMTVNNNFHLAGRPTAPIMFRAISAGPGIELAAGKSGFIDWFVAYGFTFGSGITLRNGYNMMGNLGATIVPPQATAIGAL